MGIIGGLAPALPFEDKKIRNIAIPPHETRGFQGVCGGETGLHPEEKPVLS